jgi:hypothetical protein
MMNRKIVSGGRLTYTYEVEVTEVSGGGGTSGGTRSSSHLSLASSKTGNTASFEFRA